MSDKTNKPIGLKRCRTVEKKREVKHAVFSVYLIDEMIRAETDISKLRKLKRLRKEAAKVWHQ